MIKIRRKVPQRTCKKSYSTYRPYKRYLRDDFNKRCGYCDADDFYSGGVRSYQIDHFAPKILFPEKETEYANLVYSCFYCNNGKSDTWLATTSTISVVNGEGFIDPCLKEYDDHLERMQDGRISAKTTVGEFMIKEMNLNLKRHSLIWILEELKTVIMETCKQIEELPDTSEALSKLKMRHYSLLENYFNYITSYHATL
ncbi:MAG: HNH endonuclease [Geobacteraceae bacterium]|nr:HNH endonuclease [Geobacteraceae bacterium]